MKKEEKQLLLPEGLEVMMHFLQSFFSVAE